MEFVDQDIVDQFTADLGRAVSMTRLEAHRPMGGSDWDMIVNYYWNVDLCKALHPSIHALEIALRNSVHAAATASYGSEYWFDLPNVLLDRQSDQVKKAKVAFRERKQREATADDLVAGLTLGFWVALFNSPYELSAPRAHPSRLAWHDDRGRPTRLLETAFSHVPRRMRSRTKLSGQLNRMLSLRNRVMHHETVWKYRDLRKRHQEITNMIGWVSPLLKSTIVLCDDFPAVHDNGRQMVEAKLAEHANGRATGAVADGE